MTRINSNTVPAPVWMKVCLRSLKNHDQKRFIDSSAFKNYGLLKKNVVKDCEREQELKYHIILKFLDHWDKLAIFVVVY